MEFENSANSNPQPPLSLQPSGLSPMTVVDVEIARPRPIHVVFLLHGLWGRASDLSCLKDTLDKEAASRATGIGVDVVICKSYERSKTYDGVDVCADRAVDEIRKYVASKPTGSVVKFSILGYVICPVVTGS